MNRRTEVRRIFFIRRGGEFSTQIKNRKSYLNISLTSLSFGKQGINEENRQQCRFFVVYFNP